MQIAVDNWAIAQHSKLPNSDERFAVEPKVTSCANANNWMNTLGVLGDSINFSVVQRAF
jgi:hypothetical protein